MQQSCIIAELPTGQAGNVIVIRITARCRHVDVAVLPGLLDGFIRPRACVNKIDGIIGAR